MSKQIPRQRQHILADPAGLFDGTQHQPMADALVGVCFAKALQTQCLFARGLGGEFDFYGVQPAIALDDAIHLSPRAGAPVT